MLVKIIFVPIKAQTWHRNHIALQVAFLLPREHMFPSYFHTSALGTALYLTVTRPVFLSCSIIILNRRYWRHIWDKVHPWIPSLALLMWWTHPCDMVPWPLQITPKVPPATVTPLALQPHHGCTRHYHDTPGTLAPWGLAPCQLASGQCWWQDSRLL